MGLGLTSIGASPKGAFGSVISLRSSNAHVVTSYGVAVPGDLFDAHFSEKARAFCGGAYGLAASINFSEVGEALRNIKKKSGTDGRVAYVFESGTAGFGQVAKVFQYNEQNAEEKERLHLLSLRFENKREFVALQAADILAYELHLQLPKNRGRSERLPRAILKELAKVDRHWIWVDEDGIREWSRALELAADLAVLLGWPRKRGEEMDATDLERTLGAIARRAASRAERRSRRRSKRDR